MPGEREKITADCEIVSQRIFDAPRSLVFGACTRKEQLDQWWGPYGFYVTTSSIAVAPGGVWLYTMHGADGASHPNQIVYQEVESPSRLVYLHGDGRADRVGASFTTTLTFAELEGERTELTMRMRFASPAAKERALREHQGDKAAQQMFVRLAEFLPTLEQFVTSRVFGASPMQVFEMWTSPRRLRRWFVLADGELSVDKLDLRVGGCCDYSVRLPSESFRGRFAYREIVRPERLVWVQSFLGEDGESGCPSRRGAVAVGNSVDAESAGGIGGDASDVALDASPCHGPGTSGIRRREGGTGGGME